ncbi:hypothetical protein AGLY_011707 [Aphis glycines]|uniref:Uncharacterized protein n=1 Tax=Aphis glycines TaxID=307491 RepID=A0A6G0TBK7_APHGL|nr:hypothetical protein AGLY_011707 [Aphis glycines]
MQDITGTLSLFPRKLAFLLAIFVERVTTCSLLSCLFCVRYAVCLKITHIHLFDLKTSFLRLNFLRTHHHCPIEYYCNILKVDVVLGQCDLHQLKLQSMRCSRSSHVGKTITWCKNSAYNLQLYWENKYSSKCIIVLPLSDELKSIISVRLIAQILQSVFSKSYFLPLRALQMTPKFLATATTKKLLLLKSVSISFLTIGTTTVTIISLGKHGIMSTMTSSRATLTP